MHINEFRKHVRDLRKYDVHVNQCHAIADEMERLRTKVKSLTAQLYKKKKGE